MGPNYSYQRKAISRAISYRLSLPLPPLGRECVQSRTVLPLSTFEKKTAELKELPFRLAEQIADSSAVSFTLIAQGLHGVLPIALSRPLASAFVESRRIASRNAVAAAFVSALINSTFPRNTYIPDEFGNSSSFNFNNANASVNLFARPSRNAAMLSDGSLKS